MILREIIHTCSNPHVARAALASIGGDFAKDFSAVASQCNMSTGALVARMVKDFSINADDEDLDAVDEATRGADQPILSGLRYILSRNLSDSRAASSGGYAENARLRCAAPASHWCN